MIKKVYSNLFFKNVLKVSTGTFLAQVLMLIGMTIITRLYDKDTIGIYALFVAFIGVTTSFVSLAYDTTIVLPKEEDDAGALLKISIAISFFFSFLTFLMLYLPLDFFKEYVSISLFIAIGTFLQVVVNSLEYFKIRHDLYHILSKSKVLRNFILIVCQIVLFYMGSANGLIIGFILAMCATILYLIYKDEFICIGLFKKQDKELLKKNLITYKEYPKYFCWSNLIFALSAGLPVLIFNQYFSLEQIAFYSIAFSVIIQPAGLISSSIRPVLLSKLAQKVNAKSSILKTYNKIFYALLVPGIVLSIGIFLILPHLVVLVFGPSWFESGKLTRFLIPIFLWYFISIPSSITSKVYPFQKYSLFYTVVSLIFKIGSIFVTIYIGLNFNNVVLVYAIATLLSDVANHFIIGYKVKKHEFTHKKTIECAV